MDGFQEFFQGKDCKVRHCKGARKTLRKALGHVKANKKQKLLMAFHNLIKRFCDGKRLSTDRYRREESLPGDGGYFYAFKLVPIRAYVWKSSRQKDTYFISHYIFKDFDKLRKIDIEKVCSNWNRVEVNGDDS